MLKSLALAGALLLAATPAFAAAPSPADAAALTALAAAADDAWNRKDARRMTGLYAETSSLMVGPMPQPREGRAQIGDYITRAFDGRKGEFRHVTRLGRMEMLTPDLAVTDATVDVDERQPDGAWKTVRRFNNVTLAGREADGWRVRAVRAFPLP